MARRQVKLPFVNTAASAATSEILAKYTDPLIQKGEIALNIQKDEERIFIKNSADELIAFESADSLIEKMGGVGVFAAKEYEGKVDTLIGSDSGKSVNQIASEVASEKIAIVVNGAPSAFDTLKEIADWIGSNSAAPETTAVELITKVETIEKNYVRRASMSDDITEPEIVEETGELVIPTIAGPQGPQGAQGAKGEDGVIGVDGAQGPKGEDGAQGPQGADGASFTFSDLTDEQKEELRGEQGPQGEKGDQGEQGPQGADGTPFTFSDLTDSQKEELKGEQGLQGEQGPQGADGTSLTFADLTDEQKEAIKGDQGPQGAQGAKGDQGFQGDQGPQGAQGVSVTHIGYVPFSSEGRDDGRSGVKINIKKSDDVGDNYFTVEVYNGETGPKGDSPTLSVNTNGKVIATYPDGTSTEVGTAQYVEGAHQYSLNIKENSTAAASLGDAYINQSNGHLVIRKESGFEDTNISIIGPQGYQGDQGPQGAQGAKGDQGFQGGQGPQGAQGAEGATGAQGKGIASVDSTKNGKTTNVTVTLTDATTEMFSVSDGIDGTNGVTPQLRIVGDGKIEVSYDNGASWIEIGTANYHEGGSAYTNTYAMNIKPSAAAATNDGDAYISDDGVLNIIIGGVATPTVNVKGPQGANGNGIASVTTANTASAHNITILLDDNTSKTVTVYDGVQGPQGNQGNQGPQGDQGPQGAQGAEGNAGRGISSVSGNLTTNGLEITIGFTDDTVSPTMTLPNGRSAFDVWRDNGHKNETTEDFFNYITGDQGPQGAQGPQGKQGSQGASGKSFTFADLTSTQKEELKGEQGPQGPQGANGTSFTWNDLTADQKNALKGEQGVQGPKGESGASFTWNDLTDTQKGELRGEQGAQGPKGSTGPAGTFGGTLTSDITPDSGNTYNIGSSEKHIKNIHANALCLIGKGSTSKGGVIAFGDTDNLDIAQHLSSRECYIGEIYEDVLTIKAPKITIVSEDANGVDINTGSASISFNTDEGTVSIYGSDDGANELMDINGALWVNDKIESYMDVTVNKGGTTYSLSALTDTVNNISTTVNNISSATTNLDSVYSLYNFTTGCNTVTSLANVPITKRIVKATISSNQTLSLQSELDNIHNEIQIFVYNSSTVSRTITLPSGYILMTGNTLTIPKQSWGEINIMYADGDIFVRATA